MAGEFDRLADEVARLADEMIRQRNEDDLGRFAALGLGLGGNAPLPPRMPANVPPPMPGSPAAMATRQYQYPAGPQPAMSPAGVQQYYAPIGPQPAPGFQMPSPRHVTGGGSGLAGGSMGGHALQLGASALNYAGSRTPYGTTGTTDMLGQNLTMGLLGGIANVAGQLPGGSWIKNQFAGFEEAVYGPERQARGRLSPTFERMAMAGISVSDAEIRQAFQYALPVERRAVGMRQRVERIGAMTNAENGSAIGNALSQLGF